MAADRPHGTVAFLFSDVEGSTRLLEQLGDTGYAALLGVHHSVLRSAFTAWGGWEVDNQGDAFFVAFAGAQEAVLCAADAQRLLASQSWPGGLPVRVRMGVHTGPAVLEGERYVGLDVHTGARLCAAARGGQVLLSDSTRALVHGRLPQGLALRDLGEHRLKDLPAPQRLVQLLVDGLPSDFPPPRSLGVVANLPAQLNSFVGRVQEADALQHLLGTARLVTVTGPGGSGKTRLAMEVAARSSGEHRDGVHFVPLAAVEAPELVDSAVASALGLDVNDSRSPRQRVLDHVADRQLLLVLDNFEQVSRAAGFVGDLLASSPALVVLATSRSPLRVYGEAEFPLPPLAVPDPGSDLRAVAASDAVALFVDRARSALPTFALTLTTAPDVVELVRRLDGLPLAIELAAARVKSLPPRTMLRRISERMELLAQRGGGRPERHETLEAAVRWSYELLEPGLRQCFSRFSVFAGWCDVVRAEVVCADDDRDVLDDLAVLVEHSLLLAEERDGEQGFRMLRTIRAFASARLSESPDEARTRDRHARALLALAQEVAPGVTGPHAKEQLDRLDLEHDDLRAALRHAVADADVVLGLSLVAALWRFWQMRGHLAEGRSAAEQVLRQPTVPQHPAEQVRALEAAGGMAYWQGDLEDARRWYQQAVDACRRSTDRAALANALYNVSFVHSVTRSDPEAARQCATESLHLYRALGDADGSARTLFALGNAAYFQDDTVAAREAYEECLDLATTDSFLRSWGSYMLALAEQGLGREREAAELYRQACRLFAGTGDVSGTVLCLNALAHLALLRGDVALASRLAGAAARLESATGAGLATFALAQERRDQLAPLREQAPDDWAAGEVLPLEDAVALAVEGQGEPGPSSATTSVQ